MIDFLKPIRYPIAAAYSFLRASPPIWNFLNRTGNALYKEHLPNLDSLQKKMVSNLTKNGIASVHLDELFPDNNVLSNLMAFTDPDKMTGKVQPRKPFLRHYWAEPSAETPEIDFDNPFIKLLLNSRVLDVVNSYMKSCSKLIYFDLAETNLMDSGELPTASQRWHRDSGMKRLIKIFIYLNDVDEETGPFKYIRQSHASGKLGSLFPQRQFGRHGFYPPEGSVEKQVSNNDIKSCIGRAGTVVFCDTTGLHKGGYSISKPRIMFTSMFATEGDFIRPMFKYPIDFQERMNTLNAVSHFTVT